MRKPIKILASLTGVLIVAILAVILLLATEGGSRWLIHYGSSRIPDQLVIGRIQGSMLTGLSLYEIEYRLNQQHTHIEHVELSWQPMALLVGTVHIQSLYIEGIMYTAPVTKETPAKVTMRLLADISFPLALEIDDAKLESFVFRRGDTQHGLNHVNLAVKADRNGLRLKRFEAKKEDIHVNLAGRAKLSKPYQFQANLKWSARFPDGVIASAECNLRGDINTIEFSHKLTEPFFLKTQGQVNIRILSESDFSGDHQKVRPLWTDETVLWKGNGQPHIQRETDSYRLAFRADFSGQNQPLTHIQARGFGNWTSFQVERLEAHALGGVVKANGHIVWQPEIRWAFTVRGANINPSILWPKWPGRLTLNAKIQGDIDDETPTILLHKLRMMGHLLEQPFQMAGDLTLHGNQIAFQDIRIRSGKNQLNVDGTAATHLDLTFNVDVPDPASLWPGFRGYLQGKGSFKGTLNDLSGTIALEGHDVSYGYYTVQNLDAYFAFDSNDTLRSNARIKLFDLLVGEEAFSNLALNWAGNFKSHKLRADFVSTAASAEVELTGSFYQDIWKLKIDTASFYLKKYGMWRLIDPVNLLVSRTKMKPFKACWLQENSSMCVQGSWNDTSGWRAEGDVSTPPLQAIIHLLKELLKKEYLGWRNGTRS